eukprot:8744042-Pyramimonas_sp.AAC.1
MPNATAAPSSFHRAATAVVVLSISSHRATAAATALPAAALEAAATANACSSRTRCSGCRT